MPPPAAPAAVVSPSTATAHRGSPRRSARRVAAWLLLASTLSLACGDYPEDPENTLDRSRGAVLRVGVTQSEPWLTREGHEARGIEAELIRGFAATKSSVAW